MPGVRKNDEEDPDDEAGAAAWLKSAAERPTSARSQLGTPTALGAPLYLVAWRSTGKQDHEIGHAILGAYHHIATS